MKLVDVIKHAYFVGDGVEYVLRRAIDVVYETCKFHDGQPVETPTFQAVRNFVLQQRLQGRMALWRASALRVLESLCFRHGLGPVVNTPANDFDKLLANDIIIELDTLADADKVFLTEAIILWLYEFRKNNAAREQFHHATIIEEAHHILSEHKERAEGAETIIETCLRQIREFGEAVIAVDQEPSKISNSINANTATKIVFNLGNGNDLRDMANCLGLNEEETGCIKQLRIGEAMITRKGRLTRPVLVRMPHVKIAKGLVTDDYLLTRRGSSQDCSESL